MATPKVWLNYNFIYENNKLMTFKLHKKDDYEKIVLAIMDGKPFVETSVGVIGLKGIQFVVEQKEPREVEKPNPESTKDETYESFSQKFGLPYLDEESREYLQKSLLTIWEGEQ